MYKACIVRYNGLIEYIYSKKKLVSFIDSLPSDVRAFSASYIGENGNDSS